MTILRDPYFALGLLLGLAISLAWFYLTRSSALAGAARRDAAAYHRGRAAIVAEQAGSHVHCEPGAATDPDLGSGIAGAP